MLSLYIYTTCIHAYIHIYICVLLYVSCLLFTLRFLLLSLLVVCRFGFLSFCFPVFFCFPLLLCFSAFLLLCLSASLAFLLVSDCLPRASIFKFSLAALPCFDCLLFFLVDCFPLPFCFCASLLLCCSALTLCFRTTRGGFIMHRAAFLCIAQRLLAETRIQASLYVL